MKNLQGTVTEPKTLYPWILHMGQDPARSFVPYGYYHSRKKKAVSIEFDQKEKEKDPRTNEILDSKIDNVESDFLDLKHSLTEIPYVKSAR